MVDAWLRVFPHDLRRARELLRGFEAHLGEACLGTISEVFDAEPPYTPRGCVAQAWSVAEVLRAWAKTNPSPLAQCQEQQETRQHARAPVNITPATSNTKPPTPRARAVTPAPCFRSSDRAGPWGA
jgi:glycogen debranching enzyme